jgi:hypothetical protein
MIVLMENKKLSAQPEKKANGAKEGSVIDLLSENVSDGKTALLHSNYRRPAGSPCPFEKEERIEIEGIAPRC